jgi:hypothetical protein
MHGFEVKKYDDVILFCLDNLDSNGKRYNFRLYVSEWRQPMFYVHGAGAPVVVPSVSETLLGAPYQDVERLGYACGEIPWYANIIHELVHMWYCAKRFKCLSHNHAMLLGLCDTPIEQCDNEEIIVTGFQVYANTGKIPYVSFEALSPSDKESYAYFNEACEFINWIIEQLKGGNYEYR